MTQFFNAAIADRFFAASSGILLQSMTLISAELLFIIQCKGGTLYGQD